MLEENWNNIYVFQQAGGLYDKCIVERIKYLLTEKYSWSIFSLISDAYKSSIIFILLKPFQSYIVPLLSSTNLIKART